MKRKSFIKQLSLSVGGLSLSPSVLANTMISNKKLEKLTILHTNDTHSNIEPFPENHSKFPKQGGVAARHQLIQQIRAEEEHVLLLDAGDIFQGTPYFNKFGGVLEMKLMSELKYDAATMGNHDFDGGMKGFVKAKNYASFPFLCSNYDFKNTPIDGLTKPYQIFQKGNIKIGVFGIGVELKNLVPDKLYGETIYYNPIEVAQSMVKILKEQHCDLIICLSHLGYEHLGDKVSDILLANNTFGIDLIIGGHTHTFLNEPTQVYNKKCELTLINQVGWAGLQLGRVDFAFERTRRSTNSSTILVK